MTFEISSELRKSLSLLAFLNPGSASWSWACSRAAHSWADSSCSVSSLCDRPVQIELIAYEFPLACHIGRFTPGFSLLSFQTPAKPKAHKDKGVGVRIYLAGLYHTDRIFAWIKHHPTHNPEIHMGLWIATYRIKPTENSQLSPFTPLNIRWPNDPLKSKKFNQFEQQ